MSKDEYYLDPAARLDTIIGGDTQHFLRLQRVKNEYDDLARAVPITRIKDTVIAANDSALPWP